MSDPTHGLTVYLVGGAVRDELLGVPVHDRDWVVVGSTPSEMEARGFKRVGKFFPVFLHPDTKEEYALARTEIMGHFERHTFPIFAVENITIEQDLRRRDLTINAIARDANGNLVDPYGGLDDLKARRLKHVSEAFIEDPVRILRVAKFAARLKPQGFVVAKETIKLLGEMAYDLRVGELVPERIWQELSETLMQPGASSFFTTLRDSGALMYILPELDELFGVPHLHFDQTVDMGKHTLRCLDAADRAGLNGPERFALLMHNIGLGVEPDPDSGLDAQSYRQSHGLALIRNLFRRLRVPRAWSHLAGVVFVYQWELLRWVTSTPKPKHMFQLLDEVDAFRRPEIVASLARCCTADYRALMGDQADCPLVEIIQRCLDAANSVDTRTIATQLRTANAPSGTIAKTIRKKRAKAIRKLLKDDEAKG